MKINNTRLHVRIPKDLLHNAYEKAHQGNDTISRVVRACLEAYAASQPPTRLK